MHRGPNARTCVIGFVVGLPLVGVNATVAPPLLNPVNSAQIIQEPRVRQSFSCV